MDKINLLMIDDDKIFLSSAKAYLSVLENEINIIAIDNPVDALEYIQNNSIDIIFVDFFMPQMTGEKFIEKLREFNEDILVILQTGYADKRPPIEMLESMNIQGYFDKTKSPEELEIIVRSTIKTYKLIQTIKEKDNKINMLNYKNEFMGGLIVGITDSLKSQVMAISGAKEVIKDVANSKKLSDIEAALRTVETCIAKESSILDALDFYSIKKDDLNSIFEIVSTLSRVKLMMNSCELNVKMKDNIYINCQSNLLILILLEIITYLSNNKIELIEMEVMQGSTVEIAVQNKFEYDDDFIEKITVISKEDNNISVSYNRESKILTINVERM